MRQQRDLYNPLLLKDSRFGQVQRTDGPQSVESGLANLTAAVWGLAKIWHKWVNGLLRYGDRCNLTSYDQ